MKALPVFRFRLYVAGSAPNSGQAVANLSALCRRLLPGRHQIEVVDVFREPRRALADSVFMTPTLVKLAPMPVVKIVGSLSQTRTLLHALGLDEAAAPTVERTSKAPVRSGSPLRAAHS